MALFGVTNSMNKVLYILFSVLIVFGFSYPVFYAGASAVCPTDTYCFLAPLPQSATNGEFCDNPVNGVCLELKNDFKLGDYVNGIFKIGIALAGALAVIMFVIGGITYMVSAVVGQKQAAKDMMLNAILGLLLALGSYALLYTINTSLIKFNVIDDSTSSGGGSSGGGGAGGVVPISGQINESCSVDQPGGWTCTPSSFDCSIYVSAINSAAGAGTESAKVLKAIMRSESSCNPNSTSSAPAYGLFQLKIETANAWNNGCTTSTINAQWLKNPSNASAMACIAKNYLIHLKSLPTSQNSWRNAVAGYNGGQGDNGALGISEDCVNDISCLNGDNVLRWECPWDDAAHTDPNEGYQETRDYVRRISYCLANPPSWTGESSFNP